MLLGNLTPKKIVNFYDNEVLVATIREFWEIYLYHILSQNFKCYYSPKNGEKLINELKQKYQYYEKV